jgi:AcrR family transcriptional regulator
MATTPTPDVVALVRRLYQDGVPVKDICAKTGITRGTMYRCLEGKFDDGSGVPPALLPRRRADTRIGSRGALIARMWRTAERQVGEIEDRLKAAGLKLAERESNTRMLSIVARTLRELSAVDEADMEASKDNNDDAPPRNIDELRSSLARKLEAFSHCRRQPWQPSVRSGRADKFRHHYRRYVKPGATAADVRAMRVDEAKRSIAIDIGMRCAATSCPPVSTTLCSISG